MAEDVCRLCLSTTDLFSIYDKRIHEDMKNIIQVTTSIQIVENDDVTNKICKPCCQFAIQAFKFRSKAIKNDKVLKEKLLEKTRRSPIPKIKIVKNFVIKKKCSPKLPEKKEKILIHPSVKTIMYTYPHLNYPSDLVLSANYGAYVTLMVNDVKDWFEEQAKKKLKNTEGIKVEQSIDNKDKEKREEHKRKAKSIVAYDEELIMFPIEGQTDLQLHRKRMKLNECKTQGNEIDSDIQKVNQSDSCEAISSVSKIKSLQTLDNVIINLKENLNHDVDVATSQPKSTLKSLLLKGSKDGIENDNNEKVPETTETNSDTLNDKCDFIKSLNLEPKSPNNFQDLLSSVNKSQPLFTCKVCDSIHYSIKDLKNHQRKTHTKCPFCNAKFRTLQAKNDHIKISCGVILDETVQLKDLQIKLTKVEEIESIKNKYKDVIENQLQFNGEQTEVTTPEVDDNASMEIDIPAVLDKKDEELIVTIKDTSVTVLAKDVSVQAVTDDTSNNAATNTSDKAATDTSVKDTVMEVDQSQTQSESVEIQNKGVILISDDEDNSTSKKIFNNAFDLPQCGNLNNKTKESNIPKILIVESNILNDVNLQDDDVTIIKHALKAHSMRNNLPTMPGDVIPGNTPKTQILKNLYTELDKYKIPVDIVYSPTLTVKYSSNKSKTVLKRKNLWYDLKKTIDLKFSKYANTNKTPKTAKTSTSSVPNTSNPKDTISNSSNKTINRSNAEKKKQKPASVLTTAASNKHAVAPRNTSLIKSVTNNVSKATPFSVSQSVSQTLTTTTTTTGHTHRLPQHVPTSTKSSLQNPIVLNHQFLNNSSLSAIYQKYKPNQASVSLPTYNLTTTLSKYNSELQNALQNMTSKPHSHNSFSGSSNKQLNQVPLNNSRLSIPTNVFNSNIKNNVTQTNYILVQTGTQNNIPNFVAVKAQTAQQMNGLVLKPPEVNAVLPSTSTQSIKTFSTTLPAVPSTTTQCITNNAVLPNLSSVLPMVPLTNTQPTKNVSTVFPTVRPSMQFTQNLIGTDPSQMKDPSAVASIRVRNLSELS